jgi:hypothetical protein
MQCTATANHKSRSASNLTKSLVLCLNPGGRCSNQLREELYTLNTDAPGIYGQGRDAAVPSTVRIAMRGDVLPMEDGSVFGYVTAVAHLLLSMSVLNGVGRFGKGDSVFVPILATNRSKEIWGEDSFEFRYVTLVDYPLLEFELIRPSRPERWGSVPEGATNMPGVWGNLMSFSGGSRACIGYQFSIIECVSLTTPPSPYQS